MRVEMILARDPSGINRGLVEIIAREASIPTGDAARRHDASRLATTSEQPVRDLMVAEARRVRLGRERSRLAPDGRVQAWQEVGCRA